MTAPIACYYRQGEPAALLSALLQSVALDLPAQVDSLTIRGVLVEFSELADAWEVRVFYDNPGALAPGAKGARTVIGWARQTRGRVRHAIPAEQRPGSKWRRALCGKWLLRVDLVDDTDAPGCAGCQKGILSLEKLVRGKCSY